jgi:O-methyltransferase
MNPNMKQVEAFRARVCDNELARLTGPDDAITAIIRVLLRERRVWVDVARLRTLDELCATAPPDGAFVECGSAMGGCLAIMARHGRTTYGFDSFEAQPELTEEDEGQGQYAVGLVSSGDEREAGVAHTFELVNVPMDHVHVVKGWFADTLPVTDTGPIAVLRVDANWYEGTHFVLEQFYDRVVPGGTVVIDSYGVFVGCRRAVDEFRARRQILSPLVTEPTAWWRK